MRSMEHLNVILSSGEQELRFAGMKLQPPERGQMEGRHKIGRYPDCCWLPSSTV
jgi:hypothetical protein